MNTNEVLNPIKWRARIIKGNVVVLKFFVENNRTIDINLPINKLKQITQIFREIIGRTGKDELIKTDWDDIIFQFKRNNSEIKMLSNNEKSTVAIAIETLNGINAEVEVSPDELKNLINLSKEQLKKMETL